MVTVIDYKERTTEDGEQFYVLILQGGVEMVRSQQTGRFYATAKKASHSVVSAFLYLLKLSFKYKMRSSGLFKGINPG